MFSLDNYPTKKNAEEEKAERKGYAFDTQPPYLSLGLIICAAEGGCSKFAFYFFFPPFFFFELKLKNLSLAFPLEQFQCTEANIVL
jgi:hypothetical protein